jgi:flavin-dependent dehydrogenase
MGQDSVSSRVGARHPLRVAIVGAGLAGSALAILLAREGDDVTLFDAGSRPDLLVGESLVPAVVPILRRLGLEDETAAFSRIKPGVSFVWTADDRVSVTFNRFAPAVFPYAYNVPRPRFDETLLAKALASGVRHVRARARLEAVGADDDQPGLALAPETLATVPALADRPPDLVVDATGRTRYGARVLGIPARLGPRKDVAHFAHFEGCQWDEPPGQVLIARRSAGWSWCIPLADRLSIGIVLGQEDAARLGRTPEERLERAVASDRVLAAIADGGKRVTDVATYANYQLISERGHGRGWVMLGDAFGFVDPMLSPGVFLALRSAELLAEALGRARKRRDVMPPAILDAALAAYAGRQEAMLSAWLELVAYLYDGRLAALIQAGRSWMPPNPGIFKRAAQTHIARHVGLLASGAATTSVYSRGLLRVLGRHGLRGVDPREFAIR